MSTLALVAVTLIGRAAEAPAGRQVRRLGESAGDGLEFVVEPGDRVRSTVSNVTTSSSSWLLRARTRAMSSEPRSGRREHADLLDRPVAAIEREEQRPAQCVEPGAVAAVDAAPTSATA